MANTLRGVEGEGRRECFELLRLFQIKYTTSSAIIYRSTTIDPDGEEALERVQVGLFMHTIYRAKLLNSNGCR